MSIYNHAWSPDDEITSDLLNGMVADANNSTDQIHPQYENNLDLGNIFAIITRNTSGNHGNVNLYQSSQIIVPTGVAFNGTDAMFFPPAGVSMNLQTGGATQLDIPIAMIGRPKAQLNWSHGSANISLNFLVNVTKLATSGGSRGNLALHVFPDFGNHENSSSGSLLNVDFGAGATSSFAQQVNLTIAKTAFTDATNLLLAIWVSGLDSVPEPGSGLNYSYIGLNGMYLGTIA